MGERVVVTGAAGFIGSNLCQALLARGYAVTGIDNLSAGRLENVPAGVDFREADINDADLARHFRSASSLFHLAAKNCLADCAANPVETAKVNVQGTVNVMLSAAHAGLAHVIYADTSAEYEGILSFPSRTEEVRPLSVYACSKRGGALMMEALGKLHGISTTFLRYFNVYGPAQDWRRTIPPLMSAFTLKLLAGERPVIYGDGHKRRDFIHVDDVNAFHLKVLAEPGLRGGIYNVGTGRDWSVREIFDHIAGRMGSRLEPVYLPDLPAEAQRTQADIAGTLSTGWKPKISLEEGVAGFIEYARERLTNRQTSPAHSSLRLRP